MTNMTIRAVMRDQNYIDLEQPKLDAFLTFATISRAAKLGIELPVADWIPNKWRTEIFLEFMNPVGIIQSILFFYSDHPTVILNALHFANYEGDRKLYIKNDDLLNPDSLTAMTMSDVMDAFESEVDDEEAEGWDLTVDPPYTDFQPAPPSVIDLAPKVSKKNMGMPEIKPKYITDWFSKDAMILTDAMKKNTKTLWKLYVNGQPWELYVDSISWMQILQDKSNKPDLNATDIFPNLFPEHDLVDLMKSFIYGRNLKICAHPAGTYLANPDDADHKIFYGENNDIIYISPLSYSYPGEKYKGNSVFDGNINFD